MILDKEAKELSFVCFGGQDWWYHNRGHIDFQLMKRFSSKGAALYVNSIVMQKPNLREGKKFIKRLVRKTKSILSGLKIVNFGFWAYSPFTLPVHHISWARPLNEMLVRFQVLLISRKIGIRHPVVWVVCPAACDTAIKMRKSALVYQRTDLYEEFPNVDYTTIKDYDRRLKESADLTIFVNRRMYAEESRQCKKAFFLDHGVDFNLFALEEEIKTPPSDILGIKKPVIGYFGTIDGHTVDIEFLEKVVELLPDMSFVFIGDVSSPCSSLKSKENVWMLGQKPYEQIPYYGNCFDVSIMAWRQTKWIESCNPVKLKEYLALGKPVVSTPFAELKSYRDVIYEATTPEEFAECIKKALAEDSPERIATRRKKVQTSTWDGKAELVLRELFSKANKHSN